MILLFIWQTKKKKDKVLLSFQEKRNFCLRDFWYNLLCCLHNQLCWQTDLPVCLPAQVRLCRSQWQACVTLYAPGTIHMWLWYISSSFVVHKFKMTISPGFFFKIFLVGRRSKGKKCPKLTKNSVCCCALCLRNHTSEGLIQRFF